MDIFLAFAPPLLAALLTFWLSSYKAATRKKRQNSTTEFKITLSRRYPDDAQPKPSPPPSSKSG